ncbi:MAG: hypothetical protein NC548_35885 [Lachnospiraceae bacterium]|nr:hypothetical protein [Lachnospiraceae bacterium]
MKVLTGNEHLVSNGRATKNTLLDFWKWNSSDLLNNTMRGAFAEFLVATALDIDLSEAHVDWESYDLLGKNGERIEVKCSAYLQSWNAEEFTHKPEKYSKIIFSISPALEWMREEAKYSKEPPKRHSDVYVFCHYKCKERKADNPLNLDNWDFFVLATYKINQIFGASRSVSRETLISRGQPILCGYSEIRNAIEKEYADHLAHLNI